MILKHNVYVNICNNNVIITLTDNNGKVLYWNSSGKMGFCGPKKITTYAAQLVANSVKKVIKLSKIKYINIIVSGFGITRDSCIRSLFSNFYTIYSFRDSTPILYNGCRPKKVRRT